MKLSRFLNPDAAMSQELITALSVFSTQCMVRDKSEVTPEDAVEFLVKWGGQSLAEEFRPECLLLALPSAP